MSQKSNVYFPSLNGIRAIAAFLVILHHIENIKSYDNHANLANIPFISIIGSLGVTLFFVLSGFLITYLLLEEKKVSNTIKIRAFYIRRILRIWPLYYFVLLVTLLVNIYFLMPQGNMQFFFTQLILYICFLPNAACILYAGEIFPGQLWSIGTEEQFYLAWPWVIKKSKPRFLLLSILTIFFIVTLLRLAFNYFSDIYELKFHNIPVFRSLWLFFERFRIDCMAIGAIGAYFVFFKEKYTWLLSIIFSKIVQFIAYFALCIFLAAGLRFGLFVNVIYSLLFLLLIMNVSSNHNSILSLENKVFNFLGKISYGLYVYHFLVLLLLMNVLNRMEVKDGIIFNIIYYIGGIVLIIVVSYFSYNFFEKRFLKLKTKYTSIVSGDDAKINDKK